jgi:hypothetical protein
MLPAPVTRTADSQPASSLREEEMKIRFPAVPVSWMDRLLERGEPDSDWYDFAEKRPVWTMWWFRACAAALCIGLVWFFWQTL